MKEGEVMKKCDACGGESEVCEACGRELHHHFIDFIDKMEIIYAILLAWGFAEATRSVISDIDWDFAPLLLIDALVFIRFFFAPERNLRSVALATRDFPRWHWLIFIYDIPILVFHSYLYYSMCVAIIGARVAIFYQWFVMLLVINVLWLTTITARIKHFDKSSKKDVFPIWIVNNFIHVLFFCIVFALERDSWLASLKLFSFSKKVAFVIEPGSHFYWLVFAVGISNCCVDLILSSSDYMGFRLGQRSQLTDGEWRSR
jgi:hypothetical protein